MLHTQALPPSWQLHPATLSHGNVVCSPKLALPAGAEVLSSILPSLFSQMTHEHVGVVCSIRIDVPGSVIISVPRPGHTASLSVCGVLKEQGLCHVSLSLSVSASLSMHPISSIFSPSPLQAEPLAFSHPTNYLKLTFSLNFTGEEINQFCKSCACY